ncbi:MAG TPA: amidohydrolase family protein, partial [Candidatus Dormibacteraeota bacterium]|nr:amidohydrolase family protein [Candidatus Dormibacteraeota bacterium]
SVPSMSALTPYLSDHWREYVSQSGFRGPADTMLPAAGGAGSDPPAVVRDALDGPGTDLGILCCSYPVDALHNPDLAAELSRAVNDWQSDEWLALDPRLRASIVVPVRDPSLAAEEIDRVGDRPGFVQVALPACSPLPYGNRIYLPLLEAAARHDLAVALRPGGASGNPPTGAGWPSFRIEDHVGVAQVFQSQVLSLIVEGVFDRLPALRVVCVEGGFAWVPSLMWRMDKEWKGLRREVPWNSQVPSRYVRDRIRFTTTSMDAPPAPLHLLQIIDQMESEELLLFASHHPHEIGGEGEAMLDALPVPLRQAVLGGNAWRFYGLQSPAEEVHAGRQPSGG